MRPLTKSLQTASKKLDILSLDKLTWFLKETFETREMSVPAIAKLCDTYPNRIRRLLKKCGFTTRSRSEAQALALQQGRHPHPTKGKKRSQETKVAISETMSDVWKNLTPVEQEYRSQIGRDHWNSLTEQEQQDLHNKANEGIRKAVKEGSQLERHLLKELLVAGYHVDFHRDQVIKNEQLQIDLLLPGISVAIEVDGPSHFLPVWGEETLQKTQAADSQKNGLLLDLGYCVIRVQQRKNLSNKYKRDVVNAVLATLVKIQTKFPSRSNRYIVLGDI